MIGKRVEEIESKRVFFSASYFLLLETVTSSVRMESRSGVRESAGRRAEASASMPTRERARAHARGGRMSL